MKNQRSLQKPNIAKPHAIKGDLLDDLRTMIEQARQSVAIVINMRLTILYWRMGVAFVLKFWVRREQDMEKKL